MSDRPGVVITDPSKPHPAISRIVALAKQWDYSAAEGKLRVQVSQGNMPAFLKELDDLGIEKKSIIQNGLIFSVVLRDHMEFGPLIDSGQLRNLRHDIPKEDRMR